MKTELRKAPQAGTPLRCALLGGMESHSGIYLGTGIVAELHGDGYLQRIPLYDFLNGNDEPNPRSGLRIYAACDAASGRPLASPEVLARTRRVMPARGKRKPLHYDFLYYNCHRFTAGCISGRFSGGGNGAFTSDSLQYVISQCLNNGRSVEWRPVNPATPGFEYLPTPGKIAFKTLIEIGKQGVFGMGHHLLELALGFGMGEGALLLASGEDVDEGRRQRKSGRRG